VRVCMLNSVMASLERVMSADVMNVFNVEERDNVRRMLHVSIRSRHFRLELRIHVQHKHGFCKHSYYTFTFSSRAIPSFHWPGPELAVKVDIPLLALVLEPVRDIIQVVAHDLQNPQLLARAHDLEHLLRERRAPRTLVRVV
jgi:hypothetical protein